MEKRESGGASFTDFTEVSCMGVSLSSVFWLSVWCLSLPPPLHTFFTACQLLPNTTLLSNWKAHNYNNSNHFCFHTLSACTGKKKAKKKSLMTCMNAGEIQTCVRITLCVHVGHTPRLATRWHFESSCTAGLRAEAKNKMLIGGECLFKLTW